MTPLLSGPLADSVFEPALHRGGMLAGVFGDLLGNTAGSGMALMFVLFGGIGLVVSLAGFGLKSLLALDEVKPREEA